MTVRILRRPCLARSLDEAMRNTTLLTAAMLLARGSAFCQNSVDASSAKPAGAASIAIAAAASAATPAQSTLSTPEMRSAAALALSSEPTFDEGTAQRIRDAALSYSDIAVRGG